MEELLELEDLELKKEFPLKLKLALATRLRLNSINQSLLKASQLL